MNVNRELGKQLRADEEKKYTVFLEGNKVYKEYTEQGRNAKEEANVGSINSMLMLCLVIIQDGGIIEVLC